MFRRLRVAFNNRLFTKISLIFLILGAVVNLLAYKFPVFQWSADYAVQIMYVYILLGFIFLVFDNKKLMLTSLLIAALLAYFLKSFTDSKLKLPAPNNETKVKISLNNLADIDGEENKAIDAIIKNEPDIVIFDEFTPEWVSLLMEDFGKSYHCAVSLPRIDPYGMIIFTTLEVVSQDTFYYEETPIIKICLIKENRKFNLYSTYVKQPVDDGSTEHLNGQFKLISNNLVSDSLPKLVTGFFNIVSWSGEIQDFKSKNNLIDSRNIYQISIHGQVKHLFDKPISHILISKEFECTRFSINKADNDEFGIRSIIQFKTSQ